MSGRDHKGVATYVVATASLTGKEMVQLMYVAATFGSVLPQLLCWQHACGLLVGVGA